mgnify:CR=1 FL=1
MDPDLVRQQYEEESLSRMTDRAAAPPAAPLPQMPPAPHSRSETVEPAWRDAIPPRSPDELHAAAVHAWPILAASAKSALLAFLGALIGHAGGLAAAGFLELERVATLFAAAGSSVFLGLMLSLSPLRGKGRASTVAALGAVWPGAILCAGAIVVAALRAPVLDAANPWHWGGLTLAGVASIALAWALTHTRLNARIRPPR